MKVAIVGSRTFEDYTIFTNYLAKVLKEVPEMIISGGAKGADSLASRYAQEHNIPLKEILPNWSKYGQKAGLVRNIDIIKACDICIAFWDGSSHGTKYDIQLCHNFGKQVFIYNTNTKVVQPTKIPFYMSTSMEVRIEALKLATQYNETRSQQRGYVKSPVEVMRIAAWYANFITDGKIPEDNPLANERPEKEE